MSGALSPVHWLIIIGVVVVLFGAKKMPEAARGIGQSLRIFKAEFSAASDDTAPAAEPHRTEDGRSESGRDGPGGSAVLGAVDMPGESAASSRSFSPAHDVSPAGGEEHRRVNGR